MERLLLASALVPICLIGSGSNEEIAIIMRNDEKYSNDDLKQIKAELLHSSLSLMEQQNRALVDLLQRYQEELFEKIRQMEAGCLAQGVSHIERQNEEIAQGISFTIRQNLEMSEALAALTRIRHKTSDLPAVFPELKQVVVPEQSKVGAVSPASRDSDVADLGNACNLPAVFPELKQVIGPQRLAGAVSPASRDSDIAASESNGWENQAAQMKPSGSGKQMPKSTGMSPVRKSRKRWDDRWIGVTVSGSFLYWKVFEEGLDYVMTGVQNANGVAPSGPGRTYRPDFGWDPGYRVNANYRYQNQFDLDFTWTGFHSTASDNIPLVGAGSAGDVQNPAYWSVWTAPGGLHAAVNSAEALWKLDYWTWHLMTGILLQPRRYFSLKPSFGVTGARLDQDYNVGYSSAGGSQTEQISMKNRFNGTGLRGSLAFAWDPVPRYFGFHSLIGASLFYGSFHVSEIQTNNSVFNGTIVTGTLSGQFLNVEHNPRAMKPELDLSVGLHVHCPVRDWFQFKFRADWDLLLWWDQNQMLRFLGPDTIASPQQFRGHFLPQKGDLFMQGIDLSLGIEF